MASDSEILVIGGTGMLKPAVHSLLAQGLRVVVVARRPDRVAADTDAGEPVRVSADWSNPAGLASAVREATAGRLLHAALLWVHTPHDQRLHPVLAPLLSAEATVVQLWGSAGEDPRKSRPFPLEYRPPRAYRSVILGFADGPGGTRWLSNDEISAGALRALKDPTEQQVVGRVDPWSDHP